ncbi:MAG: ATP-binding protein [Acidimicrobiia bacterium]
MSGSLELMPYTARLVDSTLADLLAQLPALLLTGPRASGKTTTARRLAETYVRLDHEAEAVAFRADPDAALAGLPEPILLDEWQAVPGVLGAVKRAVDDGFRPGRFLLTGSVRADLDTPTWPGTGRLVRLRMYGLTRREIVGHPTGMTFVDRLAGADPTAFTTRGEIPDLRGYLELALTGGFPEPALTLTGRARQAWLESYLDQLLTRDAPTVDGARDPARLRRFFEALALNTAGVVEAKTLYDAAGINRRTAVAYEELLVSLFVLEYLPAWTSNRLSRLVRGAKRHVIDTALVGAALRLDVNALLRHGDLLGRILESFVVGQIRPELEISPARPRLYHLREKEGRREVDLLAELAADQVVAVEVKATAAPDRGDARHLSWLRDSLGDRFLAGAVLHTGPRTFRLADRIVAVPIAALWLAEG